MNPLAIFNIVKIAYGAVKIGQILWNLPKLYRFGKQFGPVAEEMILKREMPSGQHSRAFLHATADLLRSQLIDFPGVDEKAIADKIDEFTAELEKAA